MHDMKLRISVFFSSLLVCVVITAMGMRVGFAEEVPSVPVKGMPTLVDLGATTCVPCKMMEPVLEKVKKKYAGKAAVIFIDVRKHYEQVKRFGIRAIPTQVFYDRDGREIFRHVGFYSEKDIDAQFKKMGIQ